MQASNWENITNEYLPPKHREQNKHRTAGWELTEETEWTFFLANTAPTHIGEGILNAAVLNLQFFILFLKQQYLVSPQSPYLFSF